MPAVTFRTIGGVLDMYVFLGPTSDSVIQQYTEVIGRPIMPPYWSLGFQLCKYGYNSATNLKAVIERNRQLGIPYVITDFMLLRYHCFTLFIKCCCFGCSVNLNNSFFLLLLYQIWLIEWLVTSFVNTVSQDLHKA